ncbi:HdeD family acid-resistance protein [Actinoplanes sp. CA-051413]|uniref:HdeD family acid-resistance protein n=1 Tax=Actinoplanes sp. CA-051413 TaxID=3239899 RepID=UPI003D99770A
MLWSGSSPLTVVRDGMWGFLLFAGVAWLAIAWSVLRLEPADLVHVAGPVILFAAVTEAVRALAGTRTWWLNAGMAVLFAATGVIMLRDGDTTWTTPAALIGWYLMVRGAADIAISMLTRESDRIWGLLMVVGVVEAALGFFSASSYVRTPELVVLVLGGAALSRGIADLVASLRLREASVAARAGRLLELTPQRAVGVAGYSAGLTDFESGSQRASGPRHRAAARPSASASALSDLSASAAPPVRAQAQLPQDGPTGSFHEEVLRTTADLDAMLALAGVTGAAVPGAAAQAAADEHVEVPDTAEGAELQAEASAGQRVAPGSDEASPAAGEAGMDDSSSVGRGRLVD